MQLTFKKKEKHLRSKNFYYYHYFFATPFAFSGVSIDCNEGKVVVDIDIREQQVCQVTQSLVVDGVENNEEYSISEDTIRRFDVRLPVSIQVQAACDAPAGSTSFGSSFAAPEGCPTDAPTPEPTATPEPTVTPEPTPSPVPTTTPTPVNRPSVNIACGDNEIIANVEVQEGQTCQVSQSLVVGGATQNSQFSASETFVRNFAAEPGQLANLTLVLACSDPAGNQSYGDSFSTANGYSVNTPTSTPEPSPTVTPEPTPTAVPTPVATPTPTATPAPTPTAPPVPTENFDMDVDCVGGVLSNTGVIPEGGSCEVTETFTLRGVDQVSQFTATENFVSEYPLDFSDRNNAALNIVASCTRPGANGANFNSGRAASFRCFRLRR